MAGFAPDPSCGSRRMWERHMQKNLQRCSLRDLENSARQASDPVALTELLVLIVMKRERCNWNRAVALVRDAAEHHGDQVLMHLLEG